MTHCTRRGPAYWRRKIITGTLGAVLTGGAAAALASDYPDQPIRIVVPWPAGGLVDLPARLLAEKLPAELGTTVIVANKTGAGGTIGAAMVAKSPANGQPLMVTPRPPPHNHPVAP